MKKYVYIFICVFIFASCGTGQKANAAETGTPAPVMIEPVITEPSEEQHQQNEAPLAEENEYVENRLEIAFNSAVQRDFIYNPADNCFYISLYGETSGALSEALENRGLNNEYYFDSPYIERFCKINAETNEVTLLLDYRVDNLIYSDGYVYFVDDDTIKRIRNDLIEDIYNLNDLSHFGFRRILFIENNTICIIGNRYNSNDYQSLIYCIESGEFLEYSNEYIADLLSDFLASRTDYTIHNGSRYFVFDDSLYAYNLETDEQEMIISFHENRHDDGYIHGDDDYFGYENLRDVCFLNNRCFLYISGMLTYSYSRIAELDLENYTVTYLTDYFDDKTNAFTTFNSYYPFSFEYPNKYSVFVDGGSAGGTIVWDYENRVGIQMNNLSHEMRSINESARVSTTQQGFRRYTHYNEETGALSWIAIERAGERVVTVTIMGQPEDILREEETILDIINSIHIYDYVSQGE